MEETRILLLVAKYSLMLTNNSIIFFLIAINLVLIAIWSMYFPFEDILLICIPHLIVYNMIVICVTSVVYKNNAYLFIISIVIWLKTKRFSKMIARLKQNQHRTIFSIYFNRTLKWFVFIIEKDKQYNLFWMRAFSIFIIWRWMTISFLSYITMFTTLPWMAAYLSKMMWMIEVTLLLVLLLQVASSIKPINTSSKLIKQIICNKTKRSTNLRIRVNCLTLTAYYKYYNFIIVSIFTIASTFTTTSTFSKTTILIIVTLIIVLILL